MNNNERSSKIIKYNWLLIRPVLNDYGEKLLGWKVFSEKYSGYWGNSSTTLEGAIKNWLIQNIKNTNLTLIGKLSKQQAHFPVLEVKQICPECASFFNITFYKIPTKDICKLCGNKISFAIK